MIKNIQIYNNHLFLIKLNSKYFKKIKDLLSKNV